MSEKFFELQETFNQALENYKKKNFKIAEQLYNQILKNKPNHFESLLYLSLILLNNRNFIEAKKICERAIKIQPTNAAAYHNLGRTLKELGQNEKAIIYYKRSIELQPNLIASHNNLGNILQEFGKKSEAVNCFLNVIKIQPNMFVAHNNLGIVYQEMNENEKAIECFKKAIEINSKFYMAHYNLGKIYKKIKNYKEAIKFFKIANTTRSRAELLETTYFSSGLENYSEILRTLSSKDSLNLRAATMAAYVSKKENIQNDYPFCKNPFDYVFIKNLEKEINSPDKFSENIAKVLNNVELIWQPTSKSTTGGFHTSGNLFNKKDEIILQLKKIIETQINIYKDKFKSGNDYFITKWPKRSDLEGWHVKLMKKGFQKSHIHPAGWLSGCFYLKIPTKLKKDEGGIRFTLSGYDYPTDKNLPVITHIPKIFDIVLFPSPLFHETIPFDTREERHVIAFDLSPK